MLTKLGIFPNFDGDPLDCTHFFRSSSFFDGFVSPFYAKTPNDEFDKPFRNKILTTDFLSPFLKKFFYFDPIFLKQMCTVCFSRKLNLFKKAD